MTTVQVASGGGEGRAVALAGKDPNQELPSSVAGDVCAQWAGAGAVGRALPTGQHWVSLGIFGHQRKHQTSLGIVRHHRHPRDPWESAAILDTVGHHWAS